MELEEFISISAGIEKDSKVILEEEEEDEKSLKDKNLSYILEFFDEQEIMETPETKLDDLVEYVSSVSKRYNSDCLTFILECFYNDYRLFTGKSRYEVIQNLYEYFYFNNESIYYYLKYNKKSVLSKKDFQTFSNKNGYKVSPMKLLQFLVDFFNIQVFLLSPCELLLPNNQEKYNPKTPILFMDYDHHLWVLYTINKQKFQLNALL